MQRLEKISLVFLRVVFGWMYLYAGLTKLMDPAWSAAGYLKTAKTATWLYQALLQPNILPVINAVNEWSLLLLGISLILGIFVRVSSILGIALMFLYYLVVLNFPYVGHSFLVDEHIIYIGILAYFAAVGAGRVWGLDAWCAKLPICKRYPALRKVLG